MSEPIGASVFTSVRNPTVSLLPDGFGERFRIRNVRTADGIHASEIEALPDQRALKSMSHAAVLLVAASLPLRNLLKPFIRNDPFRVGIYSALEMGPLNSRCIQNTLDIHAKDYAPAFLSHWPPKQYLKFLPNVATAQLGICLGVTGPLVTFLHSEAGSVQALEQADLDLESSRVDVALVCSAFSCEDHLIAYRTKQALPEDCLLAEGAAGVLLKRNGRRPPELLLDQARVSYGIATPLVRFAMQLGNRTGVAQRYE